MSFLKACTSLLLPPLAKVTKNTVFKVMSFNEALCRGSNGVLVSINNTADKSQGGTEDFRTNLSLAKFAKRLDRSVSCPKSHPDIALIVLLIAVL
jgi:hypothetical protein